MVYKNDNIPLTAYFSIVKQQQIIFFNKILEKECITAGQTPFLIYLLYNEKSCQEDIANHYKIDKGAVARGIRKLEDAKLIYKEIDENNRRKYCISLNKDGKKIAKKIIEINDEWEKTISENINISKEDLKEILREIANNAIQTNKMEDSNG